MGIISIGTHRNLPAGLFAGKTISLLYQPRIKVTVECKLELRTGRYIKGKEDVTLSHKDRTKKSPFDQLLTCITPLEPVG